MRRIVQPGFSSKHWLLYLLVCLSGAAGYYVVRTVDWSVFGRISIVLLGVLSAIALLYMAVNAFSSWLLLRGMGYSTPFGRLFLVFASSLSTNYVTPVKAGIPLRLWLYKSMMGIPFASGSASMVLEVTLGWGVGVTLSLFGVQRIFIRHAAWSLLPLSLGLAGLAAVLLFFFPHVPKRILKRVVPSKYSTRITRWVTQFTTSIKTVPPWTLAAVVLLFLLRLVTRAFCLQAILQDMEVSASVLDLVFVQSISGVIGIISLLPMGIGAKDASLNVLMTQIGVPREVALVGVLIDRSLWTVIPLAAGVISANVLGVSGLARGSNGGLTGTQGEASDD